MQPSMNAPNPPEPQIIKISHYTLQIVRWLGEGGGGTVYLAKLKGAYGFERLVVLKQAKEGRPEYIEGMTREALILAQLAGHPNIITAYDCETRTLESGNKVPVIIMEYGGSSLEAVLRCGRPDVGLAMYIILKVLNALVFAHSKGVIHRDIKPGNVLITSEGVVKVSDYGIAKSAELQRVTTEQAAGKGTLAYIAPEVLQGAKPDARSDVWAVCVMLYEMLAGRRPWEPTEGSAKDWKSDLGDRIISEDPPPLDPKVVPKMLADIVMRGLSKLPDERHATAVELRVVLYELKDIMLPEEIALAELVLLRQASESPLTRKGQGATPPRTATRTVPRQADLREPVKMVSYKLPEGPDESFFSYSSDLPVDARTSDVVRRNDTYSDAPYQSRRDTHSGDVHDTGPQHRSDTYDSGSRYRNSGPARNDTDVQSRSHWQPVERSDHGSGPTRSSSQEHMHITDRIDARVLPPPKPGSAVRRAMIQRYAAWGVVTLAALGLLVVVVLKLSGALRSSTSAESDHAVMASTPSALGSKGDANVAPVTPPSAPPTPRAEATTPVQVPAATTQAASDWAEAAPASEPVKAVRASVRVEVKPNGGFMSLDGRKPVASPAVFSGLRVGHHLLKVGHTPTELTHESRIKLTEGANVIRVDLPPASHKWQGPSPFDVQ
jgi:serine/threonine protein kinase